MSNLEFQTRVIDEKRELDEKLSRLMTFMDGNLFATILSDQERSLLKVQSKAMETYSTILGIRIDLFDLE